MTMKVKAKIATSANKNSAKICFYKWGRQDDKVYQYG